MKPQSFRYPSNILEYETENPYRRHLVILINFSPKTQASQQTSIPNHQIKHTKNARYEKAPTTGRIH